MDYYPSANTPFGVLPNDANFHVRKVVTELQCEIQDFVEHHSDVLDPGATATASIVYQTDVTGYVSYVGVDLSKLGVSPLAELVSISNKVPNLTAKAQGKGTNIWQVDFSLSQSNSAKYYHAKCGEERFPPLLRFDVDRWLEKFFRRIDDDRTIYFGNEDEPFKVDVSNINGACLKGITIKTAFQLLADVSGGASTTIVGALPISALNFDYNPAFTHTLSLVVATAPTNDKKSACFSKVAKPDYRPLLNEIHDMIPGSLPPKPSPTPKPGLSQQNLDELGAQPNAPKPYDRHDPVYLPSSPTRREAAPAYIPPSAN